MTGQGKRVATMAVVAWTMGCGGDDATGDDGDTNVVSDSTDATGDPDSGPGATTAGSPASADDDDSDTSGDGTDSSDASDSADDSTGGPPVDGDGLLYCDLLRGPAGTFLTCVATEASDGTPVCIDGVEQEMEVGWSVHLASPDPAVPTQNRATVIAQNSGPVSLCNGDDIEAFTIDDTISIRTQAGGAVGPASDEILYLEDGSYSEITFASVSNSAVIAAPGSTTHSGIRFREMGGTAISNITVAWFDAGDLAGEQLFDFGSGNMLQREQLRFVGVKASGGGGFGTVSVSDVIQLQILGLEIRDGGVPNPDLSHAFYVPNGRNSESRDVVLAFNHIINQTGGARSTGMQAYGHGPGEVTTSISWLYNYIDGVNRDGILVGASDGMMGMDPCPTGPDDYGNCWIRQADVIGNVIRNAARNSILIDAGGLEAATSHVEDNDCGGGTIMISRGDVTLANNVDCN